MVPEGSIFPDGLAGVPPEYLTEVRGFAVLAFSRDNGAHRYNIARFVVGMLYLVLQRAANYNNR
jgi:hypothetical protein